MRGRYAAVGCRELAERFRARPTPFELASAYNLAPSQELPVVVEEEDGGRAIRLMRWGLVPRRPRPGRPAGVAPINARAETAAEKPMFRELIRRRRCLVPASGFYAWQHQGRRTQPFFVGVRDQALFAFAGLYDEVAPDGGPPVASFAVLTTAANALLAPIQDRMPVVLRPEDEAPWLSRAVTDPEELQPLLQPFPPEGLVVYPVTTAVDDARHDGPELIEPRQFAPRQLPLARAS